jgi:hypothetical protein
LEKGLASLKARELNAEKKEKEALDAVEKAKGWANR